MQFKFKPLQRHFQFILGVVIAFNVGVCTYLLLSSWKDDFEITTSVGTPNVSEVVRNPPDEDDEIGGDSEENILVTEVAPSVSAQLFHLSLSEIAKPPLLPVLDREGGVPRLVSVLEQLILAEANGGCCKRLEKSFLPRCISEQLLTGAPVLRAFGEGYSLPLLRGMRSALDRQNNLNQVPHSKPAYPLVSGDGFKFVADVQCDTKPNQRDNCNFDPTALRNRSLIFVNTHDVPRLVAKLPRITSHFFMVTHNRDRAIPGPQGQPLLESPYLLRWFGKNIDTCHPKLVPIPIGIENRWYKNGRRPEKYIDAAIRLMNLTAERVLLASFKVKAQYRSRIEALAAMRRNGLAYRPQKVPAVQRGKHCTWVEPQLCFLQPWTPSTRTCQLWWSSTGTRSPLLSWIVSGSEFPHGGLTLTSCGSHTGL
eukprot:GGOE01001023.1.p1 GENE.GGOE01001023.1~~GGOE01001023.1.p1  ORF type:complete len:424 (-),score=24.67 GGOE01001023.1:227-1498(-)